jgi:3-hydroxyacyl-CoA dehydrogenase
MMLVEVVRARHTAPEVLVTCTALARKLGKQPVIAGNAHGFIGNRIYSAYRRHAEYLMEDGASPYEIDKAMEVFGFAMGVFATSDLSGLDISYAMRRSLDATRDPTERYVAIADRLVEAGRLGRKSGAGYYSYVDGRATPDPATEKIVEDERRAKGTRLRTITLEAVQRRLLAVMANEGAAALEEGIASRASDIDVVLINGYGFPRHKGGPMWAAAQAGLANVLAELGAAKAENPGSLNISPLLRRIAASGQALANWSADAA